MLSEFLQTATPAVGIFPAAAFVIFFLVFAGAAIGLFGLSRRHCEEMSALPLDNDGSPAEPAGDRGYAEGCER